jgi:hypothetical protein
MIFHISEALKEVTQVILLREACQLGVVAEADIQEMSSASTSQGPKESFRSLLGETNSVNSQWILTVEVDVD